jgi:Tfp pilus assembly protein PilF
MCPPQEDLRKLLANELEGARAKAIEAHIDRCAACQSALEQLTDATCLDRVRPAKSPAPDGGINTAVLPEDAGVGKAVNAFLGELAQNPPTEALGLNDDTTSPATPPSLESLAAAPAPPTIPGYEVLKELGRGGMGVVYQARQVGLNRLVAVKTILVGSGGSGARFQAEAEAVARLQHPNIVQIHEVSRAAGRPFIVLEYLDGGTLADRIDGSPLPPRQAAQTVAVLAGALAAVHERGILHRDLKPSNVLLTADGTPKITDFGLAKLVEGPGPAQAEMLTKTGAIIGTPSYMAPEQAAGKSKAVGPAADVYALGAILYEMLTGRPPFVGESAIDTVGQVLWVDPIPPRRLQPKVPRDLETICLKCLEKEPPRRYHSAQALGDDLRRMLAGEPILARPVSGPGRLWRWCRRKPAQAALAAALVLLLCGALAGLFFWQQVEFERREQELEYAHKKQQQDQLRRDRLRASAESNQKLALGELAANRYASAQKFLAHAVDSLRDEEDMDDLRGAVAAQHRRVSNLVAFYREADRAERLAFLEQDKRAVIACEAGLKQLGVLDAKEKWWTVLPVADLTNDQAEKLQRDANHQLILLAALWLKDGKEGPTSAKPATDKQGSMTDVYRAVLDFTRRVQEYHQERKLPRSVAAQGLEAYCRISQLQFGKVATLHGLEPVTASDCYFVGIAHVWMGQGGDDWISKGLRLTLGLLGLNLGEPAPAAQRLLRRAAAEEPAHYWSHFWLGWALLAEGDAPAAELAFTTCLTLRPDDGPAFAERARTLAAQAAANKDDRARRAVETRCRQDADRAEQNAPYDWYVYLTLLDAFARIGVRDRAVQAAGRMLDLLPPPHLIRSRNQQEQAQALKVVKAYLSQQATERPAEAEEWGVIGLAHLLLEEWDGAQAAADKALRAVGNQPRARAVRGSLAFRRGDHQSARADFKAALAKDPKNFVAALGQCRAQEHAGEWEAARAGYDALDRLAGTDWQRVEVQFGLARVHRQQGRLEQAEEALERARAIDPLAGDVAIDTLH